MLIATVTVLFILFGSAGGQSFDEIQKAVEKHVDDDTRAEQASDVIDGMKEDAAEFETRILALRAQLAELDNDHDATAAAYRTLFGELDKTWVDFERKMLDARFELKDDLTREEWADIFPGK